MFDLPALTAAVQKHGRVARVVIASHDGSAPRETGASMLVWASGQSGTIGGGALEHQATLAARVQTQACTLARIPLGPALGQCCGGAVTLVTEVFTASTLPQGPMVARSVDGSPMPLAVQRLMALARGQGAQPVTQLLQGWLVEPVLTPKRQLWLWGAGHVGRAIVAVMAPLPDLSITWVDVALDRFPNSIPSGVTALPAPELAQAVALAPRDAEHLILTFSHLLDLDICHRAIIHGFLRCGLIGSATKWARFQKRLTELGHSPIEIAKITCPIGQPALGKHPQAIALGVAAEFLHQAQSPAQVANPKEAPCSI
jgi:xanthine dehydrogenase accessory factor